MKANIALLKRLLQHKWYVFVWCLKLGGIGLVRAFSHDMSKFRRVEWVAYLRQYNDDGTEKSFRDTSGAYDPNSQPVEFKMGWLFHQKNLHHWQAWVSIGDYGSLDPLPIPETYILEMIADWQGAGQARTGVADAYSYYYTNKDRMIFHPATRKRIEQLLYEKVLCTRR